MRGAGWVYAHRWIERGLSLGSLLVLARLLEPQDFGLVAIGTGFTWVIEGITDFEVKGALIQAPVQERALHDTAWTLAALRGLAIAIVLLAVAPFLEDPRLQQTLIVLAVCPLLDGLSNPRFVLFERELEFFRPAVLSSVAAVVSATVMITTALVTRSHWALVAGLAAASTVRLLLSYALRPYRPSVALSRWRFILRFSGWMSLATLVSALALRTDRLIVAALLGIDRTGAYFMLQRIAMLPTVELLGPLGRVLFPTFRRMAAEPARLRRAVRESIAAFASLSLPAGFGLAVVADDFVPLVMGERWRSIVPLLVVLVPFLSVWGSLQSARMLAMALGHTRLVFVTSLIVGVVHLPAFVTLTWLYGIEGSIAAILLSGSVSIALSSWVFRTLVNLRASDVLGAIHRPLLAATAMVGVLSALDANGRSAHWFGESNVTGLAIEVVLGALFHIAVQLALWWLERRPAGIERRALEAVANRLRSVA